MKLWITIFCLLLVGTGCDTSVLGGGFRTQRGPLLPPSGTGGSTFGNSWDINSSGDLAPTTTIDIFAPSNLFVTGTMIVDGQVFTTNTVTFASSTVFTQNKTLDATQFLVGRSMSGSTSSLVQNVPTAGEQYWYQNGIELARLTSEGLWLGGVAPSVQSGINLFISNSGKVTDFRAENYGTGSQETRFRFLNAGGSSFATAVDTLDGRSLGSINGFGWANGAFRAAWSIFGVQRGSVSGNNVPTELVFGSASAASGFTVGMRLSKAQYLGIGSGADAIDRRLHVEESTALTKQFQPLFRLSHITSGAVAAGFGATQEWELEDSSGGNMVAGTEGVMWTNHINGAEESQYRMELNRNGLNQNVLAVDGYGRLTYGAAQATSTVIAGSRLAMQTAAYTTGTAVQADYAALRYSDTAANGAAIWGIRARGTTTTPTVVASGDTLLDIDALGYDGVDGEVATRIRFGVDGGAGSGDMPGYFQICTAADGGTTLNCRWKFADNGMFVSSTLYVSSTVGAVSVSTSGGVFMQQLTPETATQNSLCINATTGEVLVNAASSCLISTRRSKHDIQPLDLSGLGLIKKLRPVQYLDNNDNEPQIGLIAEEVQEIEPRLVDRNADGLPQSVRYQQLTAVLVKVAQEQQLQIEKLQQNVYFLNKKYAP